MRVAEELGHAGAQDVAVYGGHAVHAPVLGVALDELVDLGGTLGGHSEQVISEAAGAVVNVIALRPESAAHVLRGLLTHVELEEHLQSKFAGFSTRTHEEQYPVLSSQ
jgi:hypothetical protein